MYDVDIYIISRSLWLIFFSLGSIVGWGEGMDDGWDDGIVVGWEEGMDDGWDDGSIVGWEDGIYVGWDYWSIVGSLWMMVETME